MANDNGSKMYSIRLPQRLGPVMDYLRDVYPGGYTKFFIDQLEKVAVDTELLKLVKQKQELDRLIHDRIVQRGVREINLDP